MHIGVDGTPLIGPLTGVGWYTHDLVSALAKTGPPDERISVVPISWRTSAEARVPDHPRVTLRRRPAPARPLRWAWRHVPFPPLETLLRCDVFHGTNFVVPPAWRTPTVVTVHDLWWLHRPDEVGPSERALAQLLPVVVARAAAVLTVSQFVADEVRTWLPAHAHKVRAIPIAPHQRTEPPRPADVPAGPPFALVLGTVNERKNVPVALDALVHSRRAGADVRLVLAGGVEESVGLGRECARRGLTGQDVVQLGYVADGQVRWLLERAAALVSSSRHEGFGLPLIEAMAGGVPVVATATGAVPEVVGDAGVLVPADDGEALGDALARLLADPAEAARLRTAGIARAQNFTWEQTARQTRQLYGDIVR